MGEKKHNKVSEIYGLERQKEQPREKERMSGKLLKKKKLLKSFENV